MILIIFTYYFLFSSFVFLELSKIPTIFQFRNHYRCRLNVDFTITFVQGQTCYFCSVESEHIETNLFQLFLEEEEEGFTL